MTNEELVALVQDGMDIQKNLGILYDQNKRFIYSIARPFMQYADPDDLLQEGYIGFQEAIFTYKKSDVKLTTYAAWKIRQKCVRYVEDFSNTKRIPSSTLHLIRKYKAFYQSYMIRTGTEPTDELVIQELQVTQHKLNGIRKAMYGQQCISIDSPVPGSDDITIEESVADDYDMEEGVLERVFHEHERKVLDNAISTLKENEQTIIRSRYWEEQSQKQIAERMNLSSTRIGTVEREALKKLRNNDSIQELLDDKYAYNSEKAFRISRKFCVDHHTSSTELLAIKRSMLEEKQKKVRMDLDALFDGLVS